LGSTDALVVRNYSEFGKLIFVRGDLGVELRSEQSAGRWRWIMAYHPGNNGVLYAQYKHMAKRRSTPSKLAWPENGSVKIRRRF